MNWDYIAGLFDGEGSVSIAFHKSLKIEVKISSSSEEFRKAIRSFLKDSDIVSRSWSEQVKLGTTGGVSIASWEDATKFIKEIEDKIVEKKEKVRIFKKALVLHNALKEKGDKIVDHFPEFDAIRKELHKTSKKGKKELVDWDYS